MPEHLKPLAQPQPLRQTDRGDALRLLSRSPHPYHRQQFELRNASERFPKNGLLSQSAPRSPRHVERMETDETEGTRFFWHQESTNSDSGTEADDEHFLKGLPAPRLRPHKGLRGVDISRSPTPSPLPSPAIYDEDIPRSPSNLRLAASKSAAMSDDDARKAGEKFRLKRKTEVVRRVTEAALLCFVGGILCLNRDVRMLLWLWRRELAYQCFIISSLVIVYPLRLLRCLECKWPSEATFPFTIPAAFDPAPMLYPPAITMLVSLLLSINNPMCLLPNVVLAICSLPKNLIPSVGGLEGSHILHWFLSCLPFLATKPTVIASTTEMANLRGVELDEEVLVLLQPLHQALCTTLQYLTKTSLLPAELQLLSIALIDLLLLALSPQAIILKALLWGGGMGVLVSCTHVLRWGLALARVPKWRLRRAKPLNGAKRRLSKSLPSLGKLSTSIFTNTTAGSDSSEEYDTAEKAAHQHTVSWPWQSGEGGTAGTVTGKNISISPVELSPGSQFPLLKVSMHNNGGIFPTPSIHLPPRSSQRTSSGRKKRSSSSRVQSFFGLTQAQAKLRKWLYAGYVYACVSVIILVAIREYVRSFALDGNEPVGWALGYLFGDIPRFRMEVVASNLQRWICLPPRTGSKHADSCHLGWVEHLRQASFGEANTRLILCAYWLAIIAVGLAIVFRLSSIYEVDTRRKVFHFMMVAMLLPATYVDPTFAAMALSLMLAIFLLLDLFRACQLPPLSKSLAYFLAPYVDGRDLKGPVVISHIFLLIGCAIPLWLSLASLPRVGTGYLRGWEVPTREVGMVSGVICVGMGDAAASLIGRRYGRHKWLWGGGKSIEGSIAFATAVGVALVLARAWLRIGGWATGNNDSWVMTFGKAGVGAGVASLTEAVLTGGNDNVVVPVVLWLCVKGLDI